MSATERRRFHLHHATLEPPRRWLFEHLARRNLLFSFPQTTFHLLRQTIYRAAAIELKKKRFCLAAFIGTGRRRFRPVGGPATVPASLPAQA